MDCKDSLDRSLDALVFNTRVYAVMSHSRRGVGLRFQCIELDHMAKDGYTVTAEGSVSFLLCKRVALSLKDVACLRPLS